MNEMTKRWQKLITLTSPVGPAAAKSNSWMWAECNEPAVVFLKKSTKRLCAWVQQLKHIVRCFYQKRVVFFHRNREKIRHGSAVQTKSSGQTSSNTHEWQLWKSEQLEAGTGDHINHRQQVGIRRTILVTDEGLIDAVDGESLFAECASL